MRNPCCGTINHSHPYRRRPQRLERSHGWWAAVCSCRKCVLQPPWGWHLLPGKLHSLASPSPSPLQVPEEQQGRASLAGCPHRTLTGMAPWGDTDPPRCSPALPILQSPFPHSTDSPNRGICLSTTTEVCVHPVPPPCPDREAQTPSMSMKSSS